MKVKLASDDIHIYEDTDFDFILVGYDIFKCNLTTKKVLQFISEEKVTNLDAIVNMVSLYFANSNIKVKNDIIELLTTLQKHNLVKID